MSYEQYFGRGSGRRNFDDYGVDFGRNRFAYDWVRSMTKIERQTAEAVIALLESVDMLGLPGSTELRHMGVALRAALDADRAPRECDPYARSRPAALPSALWAKSTDDTHARSAATARQATQQYDADPPQEPGPETPEASK